MLKNKKGVFSGLIDNIGSLIQGIIQLTPKPLLILIFLFIIVSVAYVLSIIFNAFGIYCNSANEPVQLNTNILTSISLIGQIPEPKDINRLDIDIENDPSKQLCSRQINEGYYLKQDGTTINFTKRWFYIGTLCTNCNKITLYDSNNNVGEWCEGDASRIPDADRKITQKLLCGITACEPPKNYYYSQSQNLYICSNTATCTGATLAQKWDELLASKEAHPLYPDVPTGTRNPSADKILGITCKELKPRLGIWGIDLFRYEYIFIILIIYILVWVLRNL